jgi:hypothetical protein
MIIWRGIYYVKVEKYGCDIGINFCAVDDRDSGSGGIRRSNGADAGAGCPVWLAGGWYLFLLDGRDDPIVQI